MLVGGYETHTIQPVKCVFQFVFKFGQDFLWLLVHLKVLIETF